MQNRIYFVLLHIAVGLQVIRDLYQSNPIYEPNGAADFLERSQQSHFLFILFFYQRIAQFLRKHQHGGLLSVVEEMKDISFSDKRRVSACRMPENMYLRRKSEIIS